jgi:DNA replication factor GINS
MSSQKIDTNSLYSILLRETESDTVQEIPTDLYLNISNHVGDLKSEGYDNIEAKIKDELISIISQTISLLLNLRLEKAKNSNHTNLLDQEKFVLDSECEMRERQDMILSGILNGKYKLLESIATNHKTKPVAIRFLREIDQIIGADLEKYGPFKVEDVATIPYENAQALITKNIATKIRWED